VAPDGPSLIRFFRVVSPLPSMMAGTFAIVFVVSAAVILLDAAGTADALLPVLALQAFAASSGFAGPARRGYYDMLLTRGDHRVSIAAAHWFMSVAPGVATLLGLALVEAIARRSYPELALAGGTVIAVTFVSMLSWSLTVALPRFSGAIGWLLTLMLFDSFWPPGDALTGGQASAPMKALAVLVHPGLLVGRALDPDDALVVVPSVVLSVTAFVLACAWIARADYALEAAQ
jgi:hypothetical protein